VLTTAIPSTFDTDTRFDPYDTYIEDSYVKWIEAAGGRVLPIIYEGDTNDYKWIIERINGLLITGAYGNSAHEVWVHQVIADVLERVNTKGKVIPICGIGLGMQRIAEYFHPKSQSSYVLQKVNTAMNLTASAASSYLFGSTRV
jgi:gamma-glutamyl-gamma-aminobutyrate hydrolase PuuD